MCFLICDEISFKGRHFILAEYRRLRTRPDIPEGIAPFSAFFLILRVISLAGIGFQHLVKLFAAAELAVHIDLFEISVLVHRHTAMIEQVGIKNLIHAALGKQEAHMLLELLAMNKGMPQALYYLLLLCRQTIRILRIDSRKIRIQHFIFLISDTDSSFFKVDLIQQQPVIHVIFRMCQDQLSLQLELNDGDRLVHHHVEL